MSHKNECSSLIQKRQETLMFETKPADFIKGVEASAIYVDVNGKILLLQNASHKNEAGFWGVPAGKVEINESSLQAARRELFEETGIEISHDCILKSIGQIYFRKPTVEYIFHVFGLKLEYYPTVILSSEHQNYKWVTQTEAHKLNLMEGGASALDYYFRNEYEKS